MIGSNEDTTIFEVPLFQLAFRPFFLFGAGFASLAMIVWLATLNGWWSTSLYGGGFFWHVHEMLFGFVAAIVVGFLLTAVQTWTGQRSINGASLAILFALWIVARIGFLLIREPTIWLAAIDIGFLISAAVFLAIPIIKVSQWRNLFFAPILGLFALADAMMNLGVLNQNHRLEVAGAQGALGLICVLMVVVGGRVIPAFTASGTATQKVEAWPWLERIALGCVWLFMLVMLTGMDRILPQAWMCALLILAFIANLIRWARWRFWITFTVPLLWTLHLAYLFIVLGFAALAISAMNVAFAASIAWHLVTVGGMGGLTLSMISRVSLGHTGRPIIARRWMLPAYGSVFAAAVIRTAMVSWFPGRYELWLNLAGILWAFSFASFVVCYAVFLLGPRADVTTS